MTDVQQTGLVFVALVVALAALVVWLGRRSRPPVWGPVDLARHKALKARGHDLRVYVGAVDVTGRCRFFDDRPGKRRAELYVLDAAGRAYLRAETREPAVEIVSTFEVREVKP